MVGRTLKKRWSENDHTPCIIKSIVYNKRKRKKKLTLTTGSILFRASSSRRQNGHHSPRKKLTTIGAPVTFSKNSTVFPAESVMTKSGAFWPTYMMFCQRCVVRWSIFLGNLLLRKLCLCRCGLNEQWVEVWGVQRGVLKETNTQTNERTP